MSCAQATHVAVLLAAGGSRRLGRPKQLLTRGGETLVHRAARLALATAPRRLLVVVGAGSGEVVAALHGIDCELVLNDDWSRGLASSVTAAGDALHGDEGPVLMLGCDQPALSALHLRMLLEGLQASPKKRCAAAVLHHGRAGIPAVVPGAWLSRLPADAGDRGLGERLRAVPAAALFVLEAPELVFDIDTAEDVDAAIARGWLDPHPAG